MSVMHIPAAIGTISAGNSGSCGSLTRSGEAGGEYPEPGADSAGNIPEVVATIILGLTGAAGNACLGLGGTFNEVTIQTL